MSQTPNTDLDLATARFEAALIRLEQALHASVTKVAELARSTGFADGKAEGLAEGLGQAQDALARQEHDLKHPDLTPILREELQASRAREAALQDAVSSAKAALDEAMDDIRGALGPL